jgi:hypothetical protein
LQSSLVSRAERNDIDVMVIGAPDVDDVYRACARVESAVHRPADPTILTAAEPAEQFGFVDRAGSGPTVLLVEVLRWP